MPSRGCTPLAAGLLCQPATPHQLYTCQVEAVGKKLPLVAVPYSNQAQLGFPPIREAIGRLSEWGVTVLNVADAYPPHEPGTSTNHRHLFPWQLAWRAVLDHPRRVAGE